MVEEEISEGKRKKEDSSGRRGFISRLLGVAALGGLATVLFGGDRLVPEVAAATAGDIPFSDGGTGFNYDHDNLFWDNTNKRLGIGTSNPSEQIDLQTDGNSRILCTSYGDSVFPGFVGRRARGTKASPSAVLTNDMLGGIGGRGRGANVWSDLSRALITFHAAENWSDTAQGAFIAFMTTPPGSTNPTERMRISPSGNVGIGTSSPSQKLHVKDGIARVENSAPSGFDIRNTNATFDCSISVGTAGNANYYANWNCAANTQSDPSKPSWSVRMRVDLDEVDFVRVAPGGAPITTPFKFTSAGELLPGVNNTGSIGKEGQKWSLIRATTITPGDLVFENGVRATEEGEGLAFISPQGKKIAVLDDEGNFRVKGKISEDPTL